MNRRDCAKIMAVIMAVGAVCGPGSALAANAKRPNLIIFQTDEHNFRTLGCYRDLMSEDQAFVWGPGVKVDTPHIDSMARDGAICDRYYASSPVCSPSRASFVTGLYPINTDVYKNGIPLKDGLVTFAEVLKRQGYSTSYLGKWHLGPEEKPGFAPADNFGFEDNRYMWNGGHWKKMGLKPDGTPYVAAKNSSGKITSKVDGADEKSFTTDWLADRTLEIIERDQDKPFLIMCSIPDPHTPNTVRAPYDMMFEDLHFRNPKTMDFPLEKMPKWHRVGQKNTCLEIKQGDFKQYFGMVKCIDDNIGRILADLKAKGLDQNTIVIFTSDHGDMLGEHKRTNKSMPFEASARVPFVIRYPEKIRAGKVIHTAYTTVDFAPTILGIMGVEETIPGTEGIDGSAAFLSDVKEVHDDRVTYVTSAHQNAVAAVNQRYKLVLTPIDDPWLFDLKTDPDELVNQYPNPEYKAIGQRMKSSLIEQMKKANEPMLVSPKEPLIFETQ